ncbi:hypothetical protein LguiA_027201 [Lonicera macranthoides]
MGSIPPPKRPHALCFPFPAQGHINPMLKLAKILHHKGFQITFVNTEYNHNRLIKSRGPAALAGLPDFHFEAVPDGLPPTAADATQDIPSLCEYTPKHCLGPLLSLIKKLNESDSPVTCIISDGAMSFTLNAAEEFGLPEVLFWTTSACGLLGYAQYPQLVERKLTPLKDMTCLTNGYLETTINWVDGMKNIQLRDFPSFIRTTNANDFMVNFLIGEVEKLPKASALILNTFDGLEQDVLNALLAIQPKIYTLGSLHLMFNQIRDQKLQAIGSNLWKEEESCIEWLDTKEPNSVLYVNFGSITVVTAQQLTEFAWGLANSMKPFLWIIRPDIVAGDSAMLPPEFVRETRERSMLANWCPQEQVLKHVAIGGFLTHSGWNSTLESLCGGVPLICWPFFAEQHTNCRYSCAEWAIGMEIDSDVKREKVEVLVRELMEGEKGKEMKRNVMEWKKKAEEAVGDGGCSQVNLDKLLAEVLLLEK